MSVPASAGTLTAPRRSARSAGRSAPADRRNSPQAPPEQFAQGLAAYVAVQAVVLLRGSREAGVAPADQPAPETATAAR